MYGILLKWIVLLLVESCFLPTTVPEEWNEKGQVYLENQYFYEKDFWESVAQVQEKKLYQPIAGVVPHHLLAQDVITRFFCTASGAKPEIVCIIGPNHRNKGNAGLLTSSLPWKTGIGEIHAAKEEIARLTKYSTLEEDEIVLEEEHSIAALLPQVNYWFPDSKILPILVSSNVKKEEVEAFQGILKEVLNGKKVFFIASIDFSHGLKKETAMQKDEETWEIIKNQQIHRILEKDSRYLDSPLSLWILWSQLEVRENQCVLLEHKNSQDYFSWELENTTSYFSFLYLKESLEE